MIKWRGETTMGLVSWLRWWHGELKPLQGGRDARVGLGLCERRRLRKCAHKYDGELEVSVMLLRSSVRKTKPYTSWMVLIQGWRWQLISIFCGPKDWNAASLSHISDVRPPPNMIVPLKVSFNKTPSLPQQSVTCRARCHLPVSAALLCTISVRLKYAPVSDYENWEVCLFLHISAKCMNFMFTLRVTNST